MNRRERGFYWIKRNILNPDLNWQIAFYYQGGWWIVGIDRVLEENEIDEIDERKIERK